jgi:hypothetical protein
VTDDPHDLASAYLDGHVTAAERAHVEASDDVLAAVERLRIVRALLADVDEAPISVREEHLAAALGAWDRLPESERTGARRDTTPTGTDPAVAAAASTITRARPRRRTWSASRWGAAAAAVAVVVGAGVVLSQLRDPRDEEPTDAVVAPAASTPTAADRSEVESNAEAAAEEAVGAGEQDAAELRAGDLEAAEELQAAQVSAAEAMTAETAETSLTEGTVEEATAEAAAPAIATSGNAAAPAAEPDRRGPPSDDGADTLPLLTNAQDLADFAAPARDAPRSETSATTPFPQCEELGVDVVVGPAAYLGTGPVIVGVDLDRDLAIAYLDSCTLVQQAPLP